MFKTSSMTFIILTLFSALAVSAVAAYFSIVGLIAIFSALPAAILSMGIVLEIAKLVTASWIYQYWERVTFLMKSYMISAVIILSIITSIGIFGFLSKAHMDQAAIAGDAQAAVIRIEQLIERENGKIQAGEDRIVRIQQGGVLDVTESIRQQEEIRDKAWERIQGDIDYAEEQIDKIRASLDTDLALKQREIASLDAIVASYTEQGTTGGGFRREDQVAKGVEVRAQQKGERDKINNEMQDLRSYAEGQIAGYRNQIVEYREGTQTTIDNATAEINRLRENEGTAQTTRDGQIDNIQVTIDSAYDQIGVYNEELFEQRAVVRQLDKEVGPVKYVSQFLYGDDATENIDKAVQIVILLLIFVFDPLAIILVIAANLSIKERIGRRITAVSLEDDAVDVVEDPEIKQTQADYSDGYWEREVEKKPLIDRDISVKEPPEAGTWAATSTSHIKDPEQEYFTLDDNVRVREDLHIDMIMPEDATLTQAQHEGLINLGDPQEPEEWIPAKYGTESAMDPQKEQNLQWLIDKKKKERDDAKSD